MSDVPVRFSVLYADPPWLFKDKLPGKGRGAVKHYPCMTVEEIMRYPLPLLADDCLLAMWRVASMQQEALDVIRAWGFEKPKSEIVWQKLTKNGKRHFGMGRLVRAEHETCLLATRGRVKALDRSIRSTFSAPVREHSRKPDEMYGLLERLSAGPYVELFARHRRDGWESYGNQLPAEEAA